MTDAIMERANSRNVDGFARFALTLFFGMLSAIYWIPLENVLSLPGQKKEYLQMIVYLVLSAIIVFLVAYIVFESQRKNEK
ncbi:MAG TPA: hypothetical protein HA257_09915 [Candidatus Methanoperedenaceae archaeon]|nr:hypothetical protein [Candidatus Methanoperedenaceae archaeon]